MNQESSSMQASPEDVSSRTGQRRLSDEQIEAFYSDSFAHQQASHFCRLTEAVGLATAGKVVDVGGGFGYFAREVRRRTGMRVRVIDTDERSVTSCRNLHGDSVDAIVGDALSPPMDGDEAVVCFNLMLHHMVSDSEAACRELQMRTIRTWHGKARYLFVNEYVYDSFFGNASGRMIYEITSSKALSFIARIVSKIVPSLRANTFGVGVRFRAHDEWIRMFEECGFQVVGTVLGDKEHLQLPRRLLLIREKRRDSFLLEAIPASPN